MANEETKAYLLLEDGTVLEGAPLGARGKAIGIVVFHTGMVGYQQLLTSPVNKGLLLVQTFPLIGNYGVNAADAESEAVQLNGYIVREHCDRPSNYRCEGTVANLLESNGTVGICGIDTRHLTKIIRERGEMKGMVVSGQAFDKDTLLAELKAWEPGNLLAEVHKEGCAEGVIATGISMIGMSANRQDMQRVRYRVGVLDLGGARSMYHDLLENGMDAHLLPFDVSAEDLNLQNDLHPFQGFVISDGPGNPADYPMVADTIRIILEMGLPVLGISLGHQMLALAHGLKTCRMQNANAVTFGHRGANQPVLSLVSGRTYITSQNHGYVVDEASVTPEICDITFRNSNDKTIEGLIYKDGHSFSVQFLPDGQPGRQSTVFVYEEFIQMMIDRKGQVK